MLLVVVGPVTTRIGVAFSFRRGNSMRLEIPRGSWYPVIGQVPTPQICLLIAGFTALHGNFLITNGQRSDRLRFKMTSEMHILKSFSE